MTVAPIKDKKRSAEIMLVEDNSGDVVLMTRAFRESRTASRICPASSAEQAMAMLRREGEQVGCVTPDLILLDLNLSGMNGHELLSIIKSDVKLRHISVIILSSSRADKDVLTSYNLYASGHVVKPLSFEGLRELVAAIEQFFFICVMLPDVADVEKCA